MIKFLAIIEKAPKRLNSSRLAVYVYRVQKQVESLILATSPKIAPFKVVHSNQIHINSRNGVYHGDETACEWVFMSVAERLARYGLSGLIPELPFRVLAVAVRVCAALTQHSLNTHSKEDALQKGFKYGL